MRMRVGLIRAAGNQVLGCPYLASTYSFTTPMLCLRFKGPARSTEVALQWVEIGSNTRCDVANGEKYMMSSPGKGSSLKHCKESCQTNTGCKSITYFNSGRCSHFSTLCTKTKWNKWAVSHQWRAISDIMTVTTGQFRLLGLGRVS